MLRASIATYELEFSPIPILGDVGDTGVPAGRELLAFTDAVVLHDEVEYQSSPIALTRLVGRAGASRWLLATSR